MSFLRVPILDKAPTFRRYIIAPTTSNSRNRYRNLQTLLQTVCLRRTKEVLGLPEVVPEERLIRLSDRERREYDKLFGRSGSLVQMAASGHRSKISATVFTNCDCFATTVQGELEERWPKRTTNYSQSSSSRA